MHNLIVGTTLSGKTTLAKKLAQKTYNNGRGVLVFDPVSDPDWRNISDDVTDDPAKFLMLYEKNRNCSLFIDEAGDFCSRYDTYAHKLATKSRHKGHKVLFITQRPAMIAKTIRDQCDELYAFRVSFSDAKMLSNDLACETLLEAPALMQGECIYFKQYGIPQKINVFSS